MNRAESLLYKARTLASLSLIVFMSTVKTVSLAARTKLAGLFRRTSPTVGLQTGLLVNTYELMRSRLRDALKEIEEKNRELEESRDHLSISLSFLQTTIDSLDGELMVLDRQLRIVQANRKVHLKSKNGEIVGRYCYEVMHGSSHPCQPPLCDCPVSRVWQTGVPARAIHLHHTDQNGAGQERYIEVSASPLRDSSGNITQVVEFARDITESKELEQRILQMNRHLYALNAIAGTVSQTLDLDVILSTTLDKILELIKAEVGGVLFLDEESQTLSYRIHRGLSGQFVNGVSGLGLGEGIAGLVAQRGETLVVNDLSKDTRITRRVVSEEGLAAFVSVPLKAKENVVGVLNIASREPRQFSDEEVDLLTAIGNQLGMAIENARLYQELQAKEEMRTELLRQIISAQEDERRRVARGLHDVTGQALATIGIQLEAFPTSSRSASKDIGPKLEEMKRLLVATRKEVHRLIHDLRPTLLDDLGLPAAVRSCINTSLEAAGIEGYLEIVGEEKRLPPPVEISVFRIIQEAITNVASHARAESTYIGLEFKEKSIAVQVEDDGIGFDLSRVFGAARAKQGFGLLGMKERAELLGGTVTIDTEPGRGTRILVEIPVEWGKDDVQDKSAASG
ncbi:MAG: GAF domain-containing protein [Dehalococcoidia bacterium]|nr:GAF domain-containing protein [Dehalococcoidia bacterium]